MDSHHSSVLSNSGSTSKISPLKSKTRCRTTWPIANLAELAFMVLTPWSSYRDPEGNLQIRLSHDQESRVSPARPCILGLWAFRKVGLSQGWNLAKRALHPSACFTIMLGAAYVRPD